MHHSRTVDRKGRTALSGVSDAIQHFNVRDVRKNDQNNQIIVQR